MPSGSSSNYLLGCLEIVENEVAIGRIKADEHLRSGPGAPDRVVVVATADANLSGLAHFALPGESSQIGIHLLEVKMSQFFLGTKGLPWLKEFWVCLNGRLPGTTCCPRGEFISQFKDCLV